LWNYISEKKRLSNKNMGWGQEKIYGFSFNWLGEMGPGFQDSRVQGLKYQALYKSFSLDPSTP